MFCTPVQGKFDACLGFPASCIKKTQNSDPDIAGIGVVVGFGATALITVIFAMPIMLVTLLDVIWSPGSRNSYFAWLSNSPPENGKRISKKLKNFIVHVTLGLSDQQLITGIAVLAIGFTKQCSLQNRHFWTVFDLAFFSCVTHLASLSALREYFCDYPRFRDVRVFLMLANYTMLLVAAIFSFRNYDPVIKNCPFRCVYDDRASGLKSEGWYATQMVFVTVVMFWQLVMLYMKKDTWELRRHMIVNGHRNANINIGTWEELLEGRTAQLEALCSNASLIQALKNILKLRHVRRFVYRNLLSLHQRYKDHKTYSISAWLVIMIVTPPAPAVWFIILGLLGMGIGRLIKDRDTATRKENEWAFGQVLPLLLVVLPFFTVVENFQEGKFSKLPKEVPLHEWEGEHDTATFTEADIGA